MAAFDYVEVHKPSEWFITMGGFSSEGFRAFTKKYNIPINEHGWGVFAVMRHLTDLAYKRDATSIEQELKREQMLSKRISNQEALGELIPVDRAKQRVKTTFLAVANMVRHAVKQAAPRLVLVNNARDAENVMLEAYNNTIEFLKESAKNVDWEFEGRNSKLGRTELACVAEEDICD